MSFLMKTAPRRCSNEVKSTEAYYEITGSGRWEDNTSKERQKKEYLTKRELSSEKRRS